jgi:hypothetical protein
MSTQSQPSGLDLPSEFPDTLFEAVKDRIFANIPNPTPERDNLAGGHNAVRYRLRACADYSAEFTESVRRVGDAPPPEDRYQQERQLFGFFVSGIAALESFSFFLYFAAAHIRSAKFPTQKSGHIKAIALKSTASAFGTEFPHETITTALNNLISHPKFNEWDGFRNVLAHRTAPGRNIYASFGSAQPDPAADWKIDLGSNLKIDPNLTPPRLSWLLSTLADLVVAADQFTQKYF